MDGCGPVPERYDYVWVDSACRNGDTNYFARHLSRLNEPIKPKRPGDFTYAIILGAGSGKYDLVEFLMRNGAAAKVHDQDQNTPLMAAMNALTPPPARFIHAMKAAGVDVNAAGRQGVTALMEACALSNYQVVSNLLVAGADANKVDSEGNVALNYANDPREADVLLKFGARLDLTNQAGKSVLAVAKQRDAKLAEHLEAALKQNIDQSQIR